VNDAVRVWDPREAETLGIVQLTAPVASVRPLQLCVPSVNVTVWPGGFGGAKPESPSSSFAPSSTSVAVTVSEEAFARMTVGPV
jgi:hypothetical protein